MILRLPMEKRLRKKKKHQLECFIGGKLSSSLFRKKRPGNKVVYEVHRKGLKQILETKDWLGVLGVLGVPYPKPTIDFNIEV